MHSVFIADDEIWIILGLKKMIENSELPFQVIGNATNGVSALDAIEEKKPELVFSDIRMPGLSGLELLQKLNERKIGTKVIFVSGYSEFEYAREAVRGGALDYLVKPIEQEKLNEVLNRILHEGILGDEPENEIKPVENTGLKQVIQEIKENYTKDITLTELADKYQVSASHLSGLIKSELGLPFSEYLASRRIQKAKELLADETLSIDAIAEMVGYKDYFYFTKVFKKKEGISPSKYRKSIRG